MDSNTYGYSTVVNSMSICTQQYYFVEEETSTGVWSSYSGSIVTLDDVAETLTIASSTGDFGLDQQTLHFRVAVASVATLSDALNPVYWDVYVNMVHPCRNTVFLDNVVGVY